ncbi:MAG: hypothetical protein Q7J68_05105 [Thermoplasmata archaeon]|nr:hypothetical protein [Thermoplasmata archaeon]
MKRLSRNRDGQIAVVDVILFMTIMLIASAVVIGSNGSVGLEELEFRGLQQYTSDYASTVLAMELGGMEYLDSSGSAVLLGESGKSISQLLCDEEIILRADASCDFSTYNQRILDVARALLRSGLDCAISCDDILITSNELPIEHCASQVSIFPGETGENVTITVYVWVV